MLIWYLTKDFLLFTNTENSYAQLFKKKSDTFVTFDQFNASLVNKS